MLDCVVREMTDPVGGFTATQDADSEGEEGKFFVWTPDEIRAVLGDQAGHFIEVYGVTERGNFESADWKVCPTGKNTLELKGSLEERGALVEARRRLFEVYERRVHPGRDDKVLTSWTGLLAAGAMSDHSRRALARGGSRAGRDDDRALRPDTTGSLGFIPSLPRC
jgi:uncharacterized protein YyaL (SSP411 family)